MYSEKCPHLAVEESDQGHFVDRVQRGRIIPSGLVSGFATGCCDASGVWITRTAAHLTLSHFYFSFWPCDLWDLGLIRDRTQALSAVKAQLEDQEFPNLFCQSCQLILTLAKLEYKE